jgi:tRNA 2-selenouridine synthase
MAVEKIKVNQFVTLSKAHPVIDVRSPSEFLHAHIPSAYNLPLFNDEERKIVGTAYKQQNRQQAIKVGLDYFGTKMRKMVEEVESLIVNGRSVAETKRDTNNEHRTTNIVLIHCWRGGMRSAALAWLLDLCGYKVYTLTGGYKAFRNWVLQQFDKAYKFKILGGYTGSGKTVLLQELQRIGNAVINLEALANHKGSAFGAIGEKPQPSQEMFENLLAIELSIKATLEGKNMEGALWLEDESQRIGKVNIPKVIWNTMRSSPVYFIDIPFKERLDYLVRTYGILNKENLIDSIMRIQKKLGGLETKNTIHYLLENNIEAGFSLLLKYYDKCYTKGLYNRSNAEELLIRIPCSKVDVSNIHQLTLLPHKV